MLEPWSEEDIMTLSGLLAKMNQTYAEYDDAGSAPAAAVQPKVA